jgi:hypothetical protein
MPAQERTMNPSELAFGGLLVLALLGMAGYYAWRQRHTLRLLRDPSLSPEDRVYLQGQVRRRMMSSVLMVVLAAMMITWYFLAGRLGDIQPPADPAAKLEAEQKESLRFMILYWVVALLVLFGILILAAFDLVATARFGRRHQRQLDADRRATLERDVATYRQQRNGHQ